LLDHPAEMEAKVNKNIFDHSVIVSLDRES
jgi:hypothetical protein